MMRRVASVQSLAAGQAAALAPARGFAPSVHRAAAAGHDFGALPIHPPGAANAPIQRSPLSGTGPIQRAGGGVWRNKTNGAFDWSKEKTDSPGADWEWIDQGDFVDRHTDAHLRTRSDRVIDPSTGTDFHRSGTGKLYTAPLDVRKVDKTKLQPRNDFTVHADLSSGARFYQKGGKFFDDSTLATESTPVPDASKLVREPVEMHDPAFDDTYYDSESGETYGSKPTLASNPPDPTTLWDATRTEDDSPGTWVRMNKLGLERSTNRKKKRPSAKHLWMEKDEYRDSFKPSPSRSDERYDPVRGKKHYRSRSGKFYEDPLKIAHGVDPSVLTKRKDREYTDLDSGGSYYEEGGIYYHDKARTSVADVTRKRVKPNPRVAKKGTDELYESDSGEFYSEKPKLSVPQPDESMLWDLSRPDREPHPELNESAAAFGTRAGPMELWDVAKYGDATDRGRVVSGSENDHSPADKSLQIKLAKETLDPDGFDAGKFNFPALFTLGVPGRLPFPHGTTAEKEKKRGWTQNVPYDLHKFHSPTFRARQSIEDEAQYGGTTYTQNRPAVDAEIPATALHRDKKSLLEGMKGTGQLTPTSWGGARIHMENAYQPSTGLFDPSTTPAFDVTGDPVLKKTAGGKLTYAEKPGTMQVDESNDMLEEYLKDALSNPDGT